MLVLERKKDDIGIKKVYVDSVNYLYFITKKNCFTLFSYALMKTKKLSSISLDMRMASST